MKVLAMLHKVNGPKLGFFVERRDNNLNLVRMILASAVLASHSYPLATGRGAIEPLQSTLHFTLGSLAVYGFFFISGLLVTQSLIKRADIRSYLWARSLRIIPGLLVVIVLSTLVLAPMVSTLGGLGYFAKLFSNETLSECLFSNGIHFRLPGVFETNPYTMTINGSLWTLPHEVVCYLMLAGIWLTGAFASAQRRTAVAVGVVGALIMLEALDQLYGLPRPLSEFTFFGFCFGAGSLVYFFRDSIPLDRFAAIVFIVVGATVDFYIPNRFVFCTAYFYLLCTFGYLPSGVFVKYNRFGDYSYGTYIYAWPMQQLVAGLFRGVPPTELTLIAFPITLLLAVLSWHFVERPALATKPKFALQSSVRQSESATVS